MSFETFGSDCLFTKDAICTATVWIWKLVPPLLAVLGTIGNTINIIILLRKKLRSKPCFILVFLAASDLIVLWSIFLLDSLETGYGHRLPHGVCLVVTFLKYGFASLSLWIVAVFTIERSLFTVLPHQSNKHLTKAKTMALLCGILVIVFPLFGLTFFGTSTVGVEESPVNGTSKLNKSLQSNLIDQFTTTDTVLFTNSTYEYPEKLGVPFTTLLMPIDQRSPSTVFTETTLLVIADGTAPVTERGFTLKLLSEGPIHPGATDSINISRETTTSSSVDTLSGKQFSNEIMDKINLTPVIQNVDILEKKNHTNEPQTPNSFNSEYGQSPTVNRSIFYFRCWIPSFEKGSTAHVLQGIIVAFCLFTPFAISFLGNGILIFALSRRQQRFEAADSHTALLFVIIGLLMITILPKATMAFIHMIQKREESTGPLFALLNSLADCFLFCNYTMNFFCYLWKSTLFKNEFKQLIGEIKSKVLQ